MIYTLRAKGLKNSKSEITKSFDSFAKRWLYIYHRKVDIICGYG